MIQFEKLGPILSPDNMDQAKFNAGMIEANGEIHMLYRFCEKSEKWHGKPIDWFNLDGVFPYVKDYICYAKLNNDGSLLTDTNTPVIFPELPYEVTGCEDPRIVPFEGAYYIFYCALSPDPELLLNMRIAVARTADFKSYEKLGCIKHYTQDKDAFIFPERINGKIVLMHRISPDIQIDTFDSFEEMLSPERWQSYKNQVAASTIMKPTDDFEIKKIGGGIPPIKTNQGWLIIYHGVNENLQYSVGAILLELHDPCKIIAKLPFPIMMPETDFETSGDYNYAGCVFPQGYFIRNGSLYISYGTADKYTAIARTNMAGLLDELSKYPVTSSL